MQTLYKENEIENLTEKIGVAVLDRTQDISFAMTSLRAMLRQVGLGDYCELSGEEYGDNFKATIKIYEEVQNGDN